MVEEELSFGLGKTSAMGQNVLLLGTLFQLCKDQGGLGVKNLEL
jgi:hypothetical protein